MYWPGALTYGAPFVVGNYVGLRPAQGADCMVPERGAAMMDIDGLAYANKRVAERKAAAKQRRARRKRERAELTERRTAGLRRRHARKTRR